MPTRATQIARQRMSGAIVQQRLSGAQMQDVPAPFSGLNRRDSLATMQPTDALILKNVFPGFQRVEVRRGYTEFCTGVGSGAVETVATYLAGGTEAILAASSSEIFNCSTGTAVSLGSGFTSGRWQTAMMNAKLAFVNGQDSPQEFDGSTLSAMTISGVTGSTLQGIAIFKARSYFWTGNDQSFWYSATNALGGTLTEFDLSRVGTFGGKLINVISWTHDGGSGPDDYFVAVMSSGELIVYSGSDPGSASGWFLVGVYRLGEPLGGARGAVKIGSDVIVLTRGGYQSLASVAGTTGAARVDNKIIKLVQEQVAETGTEFGWQAFYYKDQKTLFVNYPLASSAQFGQHVLNLETGAWCTYEGINASDWTMYADKPYFGGPGGVVYKADTGVSDDGDTIEFEMQTAWNYFGLRGTQKGMKQLRLVIASTGELELEIEIATDFRDVVQSGGLFSFALGSSGSEWDEGEWDVIDWGGAVASRAQWVVREKTGFAFSTKISGNTNSQEVAFDTIGYAFIPGGLL